MLKLFKTFLFALIPLTVHSSDRCWDKFDSELRNACSRGNWEQRYFFDHSSMTCQLFWYDGCRTNSRNMFEDLLTCQWLCEEQPRYKTRACLEAFDEHYRDECNGGLWRQNYYFDKQKMRCVPFWYDGCTGTSANLFPDYSSCLQTCEAPVGELESLTQASKYRPTSPPAHTHPHRHHVQRPTTPGKAVTYSPRLQNDRPNAKVYEGKAEMDGGNSTTKSKAPRIPNENICEDANPCQHNSTCVYDKLKKAYRCECVNGYTGKNCTDLNDRDPCAKQPCKNGATCINKPDKDKLSITFDCFCATGYGGQTCEEKPCSPNPCNNNGTCRTTKGTPSFFCECSNEWGGATCSIEIPNKQTKKYGKNVQLLSSGKPEWFEDLRKHKMRERKPSVGSSSMETAVLGSNYTEPDGDLHSLNGTKKQLTKSQTLRLPAGSTDGASRSAYIQTLLFSLFLSISSRLLLIA